MGVTQEHFYPFLYGALLFRFLAYSAFMFGLSLFTGLSWKKYSPLLCVLWFLGSAVYFLFSLFYDGLMFSFMPVWGGNLLFYIPAQICLLFWLRKTWQHTRVSQKGVRHGVLLLTVGTLTLTTTCVVSIFTQLGAILPEFWFYAGISSPWISLLQVTSGFFLFFGFRTLVLSRIAEK